MTRDNSAAPCYNCAKALHVSVTDLFVFEAPIAGPQGLEESCCFGSGAGSAVKGGP